VGQGGGGAEGFSSETTDVRWDAVVPDKIKSRLDYIDVLRAVAALWVFAVHIYSYWLGSPLQDARGLTPKALIIRAISLGSWGVDLFIVISGFCLAYPLFKNTDRDAAPRGLKTAAFYRRRAWRILPAYYAALFLCFGLELIPVLQRRLVAAPVNGWDLFTHVFLIQSWFTSTIGAINGPFWSIALEVQLYLAFPLLLVLVRKWGLVRSIGITMLVSLVWFGMAHFWGDVSLSHTIGPDLSKELPARWLEFALGVGAARLVTAPRRSDLRLGVVAVVVGIPLALASESLNSDLGRAFGYGLLSVGLVLICSFLPHHLIVGNLVGRSLQKLGVISFSFYLLHQPILLLLGPLVARLHLGQLGTLLFGMTVGVAVTAAAARVFFLLVEKPFLVRGGMRDAVVASPG
jgi:peptidoglycan/LPS O-acetylase OafA/YrhL